MSSLLPSTRNTRALPFGDQKYIRSDCPDRLSDEEVMWLRQNDIATVVDLREEREYTQRPCRLESEEGFTYYHLPVTGGSGVRGRRFVVPRHDRRADGQDHPHDRGGSGTGSLFLHCRKRPDRCCFGDPSEKAGCRRSDDHCRLYGIKRERNIRAVLDSLQR